MPGLKGELLGKNEPLRASTLAAMPGAPREADKAAHPEVWLNGQHYEWSPGHEEGIPEEALAIWQRAREANG